MLQLKNTYFCHFVSVSISVSTLGEIWRNLEKSGEIWRNLRIDIGRATDSSSSSSLTESVSHRYLIGTRNDKSANCASAKYKSL